MALLQPPSYCESEACYTPQQDRLLWNTLICEEGVANGFEVTAGAGMSVDIAAGAAFIQGDLTSDEGMYWVRSTATENRLIQPADPIDDRYDLVVARINPDCSWSIEVITGTPSPTPAPIPPVPPNAIGLAVVAVPAAAAAPDVQGTPDQAKVCSGLMGETDTGWVPFLSFYPDWLQSNSAYRRGRDGWVQLDIQFQYVGATVPSNSTGNIADINLFQNLPVEARPAHNRVTTSFLASSPGQLFVATNGTAVITHLYPNGSLTNGTLLYATLGYWGSGS